MPIEPYPAGEPLRAWRHAVGDGHVLHVETWGRADGVPALVLHGGPGSGGSPWLRRCLDPARYHAIAFDQRGAGRSTPAGGLAHNTTAHLLADIRSLRRALGIERWVVVGGSWGATLALLHALDEPQAVSGLLLRAVFLARREDVDAFFADAPALLREGWSTLPEADDACAERLVQAWWRHESRRVRGDADDDRHAGAPEAPPWPALRQRYAIQAHYLRAGCGLGSRPLLDRVADAPPRVPTLLLHGTRDAVCPPAGAEALAHRWPGATLRWAEGAGHDPTHPRMVALQRTALDAFAAGGRFDAVREVACGGWGPEVAA